MPTQQDLFEAQVDNLGGEEVDISFELIESEHRSSYLRFCINGVTLIDAATGLLEQARRNLEQANRVASIHKMKDESAQADSALYQLDIALREAKKVGRGG
jgi:hypothetical protein